MGGREAAEQVHEALSESLGVTNAMAMMKQDQAGAGIRPSSL